MFCDYAEAGSWMESTLRDNIGAFDKIKFRQKILDNAEDRSLHSHMVGQEVALPLVMAPVGLTGTLHADGEINASRR